MKFKKCKKPKKIDINDTNYWMIDELGCAYLRSTFVSVGPREAIVLAKWLIRYAKWSSLELK